jgi:hypothetical protein
MQQRVHLAADPHHAAGLARYKATRE